MATEGFLGPGSGWPALVGGLALSGVGMGLVFQVAAALALGSVPPERAGMAGGAYSTFEQLGYAFGVAVFGTLAVSTMNRSLNGVVPDPESAAQTLSGGGADTLLAATPAGERTAFGHTLHSVFATAHNTLALTAGALAVTGAAVVLCLTRRRPNPPKGAVAGSPATPAEAAQVGG
ncbi:hypothetical protein [Streptomyces decoyicus]